MTDLSRQILSSISRAAATWAVPQTLAQVIRAATVGTIETIEEVTAAVKVEIVTVAEA